MKKQLITAALMTSLLVASSTSALAVEEPARSEGTAVPGYQGEIIEIAPLSGQVLEDENGYPKRAVNFLTEKLQMTAEDIQLFGGIIEELPHVDRNFWWTKYTVEIDKEHKFGSVYIDLDNGDILLKDQADPIFAKERQLAEAELERLKQEAGKIEVSLYQELELFIAEDEELRISVIPAYSASTEVRSELEGLAQEYSGVSQFVDEEGNIKREQFEKFDEVKMREYLDQVRLVKLAGYQEGQRGIIQYLTISCIIKCPNTDKK